MVGWSPDGEHVPRRARPGRRACSGPSSTRSMTAPWARWTGSSPTSSAGCSPATRCASTASTGTPRRSPATASSPGGCWPRRSRAARPGSPPRSVTGPGGRFWSNNDHLHYWLGYHVPVLVILVRPGDGAAFWQVIRPSTVTENAEGFTMVIPSSQPAGRLRRRPAAGDRAQRAAACWSPSPRTARCCPPSAVRVLEPAHGTPTRCPRPGWRRSLRPAGPGRADRPGAVRGAAVVAGGHRGRAGSVAGRRQVRPRARLRVEAAEALALAAEAPGPRSARVHAVAGLALPVLGPVPRPCSSGAGPRGRGGAACRYRPGRARGARR